MQQGYEVDTISILTLVREIEAQNGQAKLQNTAPISMLLAIGHVASGIGRPALGEALSVGTDLCPPPALYLIMLTPVPGIPIREVFAGMRGASHPLSSTPVAAVTVLTVPTHAEIA